MEVSNDGAATRITVAGELDLYSSPGVREQVLAAVADAPGAVILDLVAVNFLDSTGIALIIAARDKAAIREVSLTIVPSAPVRKVLEVVGLGKYLRQ